MIDVGRLSPMWKVLALGNWFGHSLYHSSRKRTETVQAVTIYNPLPVGGIDLGGYWGLIDQPASWKQWMPGSVRDAVSKKNMWTKTEKDSWHQASTMCTETRFTHTCILHEHTPAICPLKQFTNIRQDYPCNIYCKSWGPVNVYGWALNSVCKSGWPTTHGLPDSWSWMSGL